MTKKITIRSGRIGRYDEVSPFIIAEDLRLEFGGLIAANGDYYVAVKLNGKERKFKLNRESTVTLEQDFFEAGELKVNVLYYLRGEKLAEYVVEPLAIKELAADLSGEPVILTLTLQADRVRKETEELKRTLLEQIRVLTAAITAITKRVDLIEGGYDPLRV